MRDGLSSLCFAQSQSPVIGLLAAKGNLGGLFHCVTRDREREFQLIAERESKLNGSYLLFLWLLEEGEWAKKTLIDAHFGANYPERYQKLIIYIYLIRRVLNTNKIFLVAIDGRRYRVGQ